MVLEVFFPFSQTELSCEAAVANSFRRFTAQFCLKKRKKPSSLGKPLRLFLEMKKRCSLQKVKTIGTDAKDDDKETLVLN